MLVKVTRDEIRRGRVGDTMACPLALAIRRQGAHHVRLERARIYVWWKRSDNVPEHFGHSWRSARFVDAFDGREKVKPATFRLRRIKDGADS